MAEVGWSFVPVLTQQSSSAPAKTVAISQTRRASVERSHRALPKPFRTSLGNCPRALPGGHEWTVILTSKRFIHGAAKGQSPLYRLMPCSSAPTGIDAIPEITAAERIDKIGNMSALAIIEASETTAKDIEEAGQAAVDIAADIMMEAQQLATELRENGKKMSEHLREFAVLARKVSTAMRDTRADVLNPSDNVGSLPTPDGN
jgi:vacuolar-type H+-ATPase subunit H